ncbi:hypothetical protein JM16_000616 [Phytophthora kernoviae]|uniref:Uncharacterized protein n=1 Tax=Phytophthora kernoviae TaxID=325452 RepID=A0A8T0M968_9STRA|nr:hypothetical protein JM16_000616 [Phytophthora kernoviae]
MSEEIANVKAQNMRIQQQKADITVKVAQITLDFETARSQWAQDIRECEKRVEQRYEKQVFEAEQQHEQAADAMQQQMAQFRTELDMKVARQRVAAQVACKAGELKREQLEHDLQRMRLKLSKQKLKLEKKARDLVANARKQHEKPVAALERELEGFAERLESVLVREQDALAQIKRSEENVGRLQYQVSQLQVANAELERERDAYGHLCKELETDKYKLKTDFEHRKCELEQLMTQQVEAAEASVHAYEQLLQQLNSVKQENWNLSLALHVTETTNQQQHRYPQQCAPSRTNSFY